jgi:putative DNA modification/repair radical SAM protein
MELADKLAILADAAKYDASCASSGGKRARPEGGFGNSEGMGICHSYTPDGRCVSLLKILLTNICVYDCQYCINRVSSEVKRARFSVEEVVSLTLDFYRRNYIEGLFLSSGVIKSPDYTMEELVRVARTLRETHRFGGYIHLKAVPGASESLVALAGAYADRLSANIELPTPAGLTRLAPEKKPEAIDQTMQQISTGIAAARAPEAPTRAKRPLFAPAGQSTQMIVGATPDTDASVLATASRLYSEHRLRRVYYSAFSPIPDSDPRLPPQAPPLQREHRLYQADWLIRFYGFQAVELTSESAPNLDLRIDPKLGWALRRRDWFPVDLNRASREQLLRVPGLGVRSVERILRLRRHQQVRLDHLTRLKISLDKVRPWVVTADHRPTRELDAPRLPKQAIQREQQLSLFDLGLQARSGEL